MAAKGNGSDTTPRDVDVIDYAARRLGLTRKVAPNHSYG